MLSKQQKLELALELAKRHDRLKSAEWALEFLRVLTFDIVGVDCGPYHMRYVNLGETYENTICREGDNYFISSWGDWVEESENELLDNLDMIRCGYCGKLTEQNKPDWRDVTCEHCQHNVSTGKPAKV